MIDQTFLYREIYEQPLVLSQLISKEKKSIIQLAKVINQGMISHVVIAA